MKLLHQLSLFIVLGLGIGIPSLAQPYSSAVLAKDRPVGNLEVVATFAGAMPTGVTVSRQGRIFVNFPRWGDEVPYTVAELKNGHTTAYPDQEMNREDQADAAHHFISVQSVVVDAQDRLWVLDTGAPFFKGPVSGGAKLVCLDIQNNKVLQSIAIPPEVAVPGTYLNDVRFDLHKGYAYITDSGKNGIIVINLANGKSFRRLSNHPSVQPEDGFLAIVEGQPVIGNGKPLAIGSDGIALSSDGGTLYYSALSGRKLWSVSATALRDPNISEEQLAATVKLVAGKGASDGLEADAAGSIYATDYESNSIHKISPSGEVATLVHDPRLLWPDTMSLADDGYLYVTANQLHRQATFHGGQDQRQKPYVLFRVQTGAKPIR